MMVRHADARWEGGLKKGSGKVRTGSGALDSAYSFTTRFEDQPGTNPEELIAAAHAGCFSMALSAKLEKAGHPPKSVQTRASVKLEQTEGGFTITEIELVTEANVPGIDDSAFQDLAEDAKKTCPVSKVLAGASILLKATLSS